MSTGAFSAAATSSGIVRPRRTAAVNPKRAASSSASSKLPLGAVVIRHRMPVAYQRRVLAWPLATLSLDFPPGRRYIRPPLAAARAGSSAVEHRAYTPRVAGSMPVPPHTVGVPYV